MKTILNGWWQTPSRRWILSVGYGLLLGMCLGAASAWGAENAESGLVKNGNFDASELEGWFKISVQAGVEIARESPEAGAQTNAHCLRLTVKDPGQKGGVGNVGPTGMSVVAGAWYDLTFRARTEKRDNNRGFGLTVSLESRDDKQVGARTTLPEVAGDWADYTVALHAQKSGTGMALTITMSESGTIWLDDVALVARKADAVGKP